MALPTNFLQTVRTYQNDEMAYLLNLFAIISNCNKKYENFDKLPAQLGDTVGFEKPYRFTTKNSLVASFQPTTQRLQTLTVDQQISCSTAYSIQEYIFNTREYMDKIGRGAMVEMGTVIESNVARNFVTQPYRFFGNGVTPINSFGQLATALAFYRNFGSPSVNLKAFLDDISVASIVNSGLNQFAPGRNDKMSMSWELGNFSNCDWFSSNLLPLHTSGNVGNDGTTLTVVSTNDPTGANITQITLSGAGASDLDAVKENDLFYFVDGVSGQPDMRYLTFTGHKPSQNAVQVRVTADAASNGGGQVTIDIYPALVSQQLSEQNLSYNVVAGMQMKSIPTHRRGGIVGGNGLYLAMPQMPDEVPFPTANEVDPETGISLRLYYGSLFGQNQRGYVHDGIWGSTAIPEDLMALIFPA